MPQAAVNTRWSYDELQPFLQADDALALPVRLAPSTVYPRGRILGFASASANEVQTFTATGTPIAGTFTYALTNPLTGLSTNVAIAFNSSAATFQAQAVAVYGSGNVVAGGGPWPGTALTLTFTGALAGTPIPIPVAGTNALTGGTTPTSTVAKTTAGVTKGTFAPYLSGNSDGTQVAKCALQYPCATDASGVATLGAVAGGSQFGSTQLTVPAWFTGYFDISRLSGLDATAVTALGKILTGDLASNKGVIRFT